MIQVVSTVNESPSAYTTADLLKSLFLDAREKLQAAGIKK
jgi:hypothetical protein